MLKVKIDDATVHSRQVNTDNGPRVIRSQLGVVQLPGEGVTRPINIGLGDDESGYEAGMYQISPESFYLGKYDRLQVGRVRLQPAQPAR